MNKWQNLLFNHQFCELFFAILKENVLNFGKKSLDELIWNIGLILKNSLQVEEWNH